MSTVNFTYETTITMVTEQCCSCGVVFGITADLQRVLKNNNQKTFYCPNGHPMLYRESAEVKLRKEAERKLEEAQQKLADAEIKLAKCAEENKETPAKLIEDIKTNICPFCSHFYKHLSAHIKNKHPEKLLRLKN